MPKPYDAITKVLIDLHPGDWLTLIGAPAGGEVEPFDAEILDSDLATVSGQADRVLRVRPPEPDGQDELCHIELETGHHGAETPANLLGSSVLLGKKYRLPVRSAVILLRRQADSPALTGRLERRLRDGRPYLTFEYGVVRVWELPAERLLEGGIGTLPLAPIAKVEEKDLPAVVRRVEERIEAEATVAQERELLAATKVLMGLRYSEAIADTLIKGVRKMEESVTYQAILRQGEARGETKGETKGEREALIRVGKLRLGEPSPKTVAALRAITSRERLNRMIDRVLAVESWDELLAIR